MLDWLGVCFSYVCMYESSCCQCLGDICYVYRGFSNDKCKIHDHAFTPPCSATAFIPCICTLTLCWWCLQRILNFTI